MQVVILNGVNLNMLGRRDPAQYGSMSLSQLETQIYEWAQQLNITARCWQTNSEGAYVDMIHEACNGADALVVNPGAWTHYSYAIRDALEIFSGPIVEVHLSDIERREPWRRTSVIAEVVSHRIAGRGAEGSHEAFIHLTGEGT
jgi:3-dehydroquinate dehydratase-2